MEIDHQALIAAIEEARENSYGTDEHSALGQKRAKAIEYYLGMNTNPAPEGRSQVVDRSVYETVHVILPSLVRIFAGSSDEVCKCTPVGPDDEQAADQQTAVLNHLVTNQNQWEQICADWIHDALLLCNGYALAYWDESKTTVRETYRGQSEDQLASLVMDKGVQVVEHSEAIDQQATAEAQEAFKAQIQQYKQVAQMAQMQGQQPPPPPQPPQPVILHDVVIERVQNEGKVCIKVLPPEHCYVSADTPDWTLNECPYFEFRQQKTIGELRAMGLEVPENISDDEDEDESEEDHARNRFAEDTDTYGNERGAMRRVWARMVWVRADLNDGADRLYYAIVVGRTVLYAEPCSRIPVASMTAQPLPHRHIGLSIADTTEDIQDIRTAVTRGGLDNLYLANNGRNAVSSRVNLDDFLDSRPGGVVRMLDDSLPADGHIMPLVHPFAFDQIIGSLEYFDQIRQNRTGASRYFSGTDANAINKTASGTMALQNMASMRVEHVARMMAPAVEALFSAVQEIVAKHANKAMTIKIRGGKWVTVDPQAWRTKRDVKISVGVGAGNRESMMQHLGNMLGVQLNTLPLGLAGPEQMHATVTEMAKLAGFANPDKFWRDPRNSPPMPPQPNPEQIKAQTQLQLKQMELQADAQRFQAEMMHKQRELEMQHAAKMRELEAELTVQSQNDERDSVRESQKAVVEAQIEAAKEENKRQIAAMQAEIDKYKADLDAQVKLAIAQRQAETAEKPALELGGLQKTLADMAEQMNAPAELIRDPNTGRAIGIKRGQVVKSIQRGPDGRAIGVQ